ncbi:MAG: Wzz/FepE/Etk N-terminal domain-containing protein [Candidatus Dormibacteria bacterium]
MEIRDYLRAIRRVLWLVIAVPIVAGLLTGGFMELQPSVYEADATVVVPAISANGSSSSAATQYVAGFKDVLVSQPVLTEVSQKYRIPVSDLAAGLSASTTTASSNIIHIALQLKRTSTTENLVGAVREATVDALNAIAQPSLVEAQSAQASGQALLTLADTNIAKFDATYGTVSPLNAYNNAQSQLNIQVANLARANANHDAKSALGAQALITLYTKQVASLGAELEQYQALSNARAAAISAYDHATQRLVDAQALIAADANPAAVTTSAVVRLSKLSNTIKFAGIAFALGLLMMLGLILVLELMRSGKGSAVKAQPAQGAFAWDREPAPQIGVVSTPATAASAPALADTSARAESASRDPWRASSTATAPAAVGVPSTTPYGNGNGSGHTNGNGNGHTNGNGNGHADVGSVVEQDPDPRQAVRRR